MLNFQETVYAPATSVGTGAISIIRISGPDTFAIVDKVVKFRNGTAASAKGYTVKYGSITDGDETVDDVLAGFFRAPHSYTGEDSVELYCHASSYSVSRVLELLAKAGGRSAAPGEFTQRAFLNGKMDLAQAEAVADVIASDSAMSHKVAMNQLKGGYSAELHVLREKLLELSALLELELDFSEEDVEFADRRKLSGLLDETLSKVSLLADSFKTGNAIRNGVPVAIVGPVNAGKSTLLNALVGEERAIVTDVAGTTRDTIEECVVFGGIRFRFIDTAGLRETYDVVETKGIERSYSAMSKAAVVLALLDSSSPDNAALDDIRRNVPDGSKLLTVLNKCDIAPGLSLPCDSDCIKVSAKTGEGLRELKDRLVGYVSASMSCLRSDGVLVTNQRHYEALSAAASDLSRVREGLELSLPSDLVAEDLRSAISHLGEITGEITTDEVLGEIFSKFCIGK